MKGFGGGIQQLMRQANQMQAKMRKVQEELATREFEASAGGGGVTVRVNGDSKLLSVTVKPDIFSAGDVELLQDMILAATNDALRIAKETSQKEMEKVTGGMNLGGLL